MSQQKFQLSSQLDRWEMDPLQLHYHGTFNQILIFILLNRMELMFIILIKEVTVDIWMLMIHQVLDHNIITQIVTLRQATTLFIFISTQDIVHQVR